MLLSVGAPDTPTGGSSCSRLKSLMSLRLAGVDMMSVLVCGWLGEVGELGSVTVLAVVARACFNYL